MRRAAITALVAVASALLWIAALPPAPVRQPLAFPHARHQTIGCAVCHSGATTRARAGIPDGTFCARCHTAVPRTIAWVQVTTIPTHVMFSHQRHVTIARLDCASCHGDMRERRTPPGAAATRIVMTTCLSCHRHEGAAEDCAACHR